MINKHTHYTITQIKPEDLKIKSRKSGGVGIFSNTSLWSVLACAAALVGFWEDCLANN